MNLYGSDMITQPSVCSNVGYSNGQGQLCETVIVSSAVSNLTLQLVTNSLKMKLSFLVPLPVIHAQREFKYRVRQKNLTVFEMKKKKLRQSVKIY
jgi:hypothetical protein